MEGQQIMKLAKQGGSIMQEHIRVIYSKASGLFEQLSREFPYYTIQDIACGEGYMYEPDTENFIKFVKDDDMVNLTAIGSPSYVRSTIALIKSKFRVRNVYIRWIYDQEGSSMSFPLDSDLLPTASMYPFLGKETLTGFYDKFLNSNANILILIGQPGTGKTTFIRGLLTHAQSSAYVLYDPSIINQDAPFASFMRSDDSAFMVLEDADAFLTSRNDGNTIMHKMLNVSDGLISTRGKKFIFSTNLPSLRDVDAALLRPGRCYGVLNFEMLDGAQAQKLADEFSIPFHATKTHYTIAEVFNSDQLEHQFTPFGFIS